MVVQVLCGSVSGTTQSRYESGNPSDLLNEKKSTGKSDKSK